MNKDQVYSLLGLIVSISGLVMLFAMFKPTDTATVQSTGALLLVFSGIGLISTGEILRHTEHKEVTA
jgi:hypothetical protein